MQSEFLTFVNDYLPDLTSHKTLLTVSGGVDSMVMADLFQKAGFPFALAHCNFGLRGAESDGDEAFVRQWAENRGISAYFKRFETQAAADEGGVSIQMAARQVRYTWFHELQQSQAFDFVATAHHANDALETTLLNLTRGTGLAGLAGIAPQRGYLVRPLLFASKDQILAYAVKQQLAWREDSSNLTDHYRRNLLRHQVVPVLQQINPALETTFHTTSDRLRAAHALLSGYLGRWQTDVARQVGTICYIDIRLIQSAPEPLYQLHFIIEPFGFSYAQTRQIVAACEGISGKIFRSSTHQLLKDRTELVIKPLIEENSYKAALLTPEMDTLDVPGVGCLKVTRVPNFPNFDFTASPATAYFDEELIRYPLTIRPWREGDWFCPFGMKGKRKRVSDLLIDHKLTLFQKQKCHVVVDRDQQIIWVVGIRADDRFRVGKKTRTILCLFSNQSIDFQQD